MSYRQKELARGDKAVPGKVIRNLEDILDQSSHILQIVGDILVDRSALPPFLAAPLQSIKKEF